MTKGKSWKLSQFRTQIYFPSFFRNKGTTVLQESKEQGTMVAKGRTGKGKKMKENTSSYHIIYILYHLIFTRSFQSIQSIIILKAQKKKPRLTDFNFPKFTQLINKPGFKQGLSSAKSNVFFSTLSWPVMKVRDILANFNSNKINPYKVKMSVK